VLARGGHELGHLKHDTADFEFSAAKILHVLIGNGLRPTPCALLVSEPLVLSEWTAVHLSRTGMSTWKKIVLDTGHRAAVTVPDVVSLDRDESAILQSDVSPVYTFFLSFFSNRGCGCTRDYNSRMVHEGAPPHLNVGTHPVRRENIPFTETPSPSDTRVG